MTTTRDLDQRVPEWARERAEAIQGLYIHFIVYAVINAGLFVLNWVTKGDDGTWWFYWPLIIWGVAGLGMHILSTVVPVFTTRWVERKARRLADREAGLPRR